MIPPMRVGIGYDSHRFADGRPLVLGGRHAFPHPRGLAGHSDADAVAHALTDAILGAAAAGNIGQLFPDTDPAVEGRRLDGAAPHGARAGARARARRGAGRPHRHHRGAAARARTSAPWPRRSPRGSALAPGAISVKAKTNEGMGFIGRGEGLAVIAVATLEAR